MGTVEEVVVLGNRVAITYVPKITISTIANAMKIATGLDMDLSTFRNFN